MGEWDFVALISVIVIVVAVWKISFLKANLLRRIGRDVGVIKILKKGRYVASEVINLNELFVEVPEGRFKIKDTNSVIYRELGVPTIYVSEDSVVAFDMRKEIVIRASEIVRNSGEIVDGKSLGTAFVELDVKQNEVSPKRIEAALKNEISLARAQAYSDFFKELQFLASPVIKAIGLVLVIGVLVAAYFSFSSAASATNIAVGVNETFRICSEIVKVTPVPSVV